ncbi:MAG: hypothetical protein RI909_2313 [Bacteroidota bacterium]
MEEKEPTLFQHALKWGLIVGAISIVLTAVAYAVDYAMLANWKFGIFIFAAFIGLAIYAGINYRNETGGFIAYGKAFQHAFILMAVSGLVSTAFTILLYTVIDPELPAKLTDVAIENAEAMLKNFGMPEDQMDKAMEDTRKRTENQFSVSGLAMGYGIGLIIYAVLSLITSIFVKKNPPDEII